MRAVILCSPEPDVVAASPKQLANRTRQASVLQERPALALRPVAGRHLEGNSAHAT